MANLVALTDDSRAKIAEWFEGLFENFDIIEELGDLDLFSGEVAGQNLYDTEFDVYGFEFSSTSYSEYSGGRRMFALVYLSNDSTENKLSMVYRFDTEDSGMDKLYSEDSDTQAGFGCIFFDKVKEFLGI